MRLLIILAVGLLVVGCTAGDSGNDDGESIHISRANFGDEWSLMVDEGNLRCEEPSRIVFTDPAGTEWGVNGMAVTHGYPEIDPIWADNPNISGVKKNIRPLIDRGLALCNDQFSVHLLHIAFLKCLFGFGARLR